MPAVRSTCCYCGVGCGVVIETAADRITAVKGDPDHPANFGRLCTKGSTLHLTASPEGRALYPELRRARGEPRERTTWNHALDFAAERFAAIIREHGPDAVAFYISGQLLTEDYYVFNKLAKGLVGTNNVDTNSRLCMSSAVAGYKATLGADSVPTCYEDIDHAVCILIAGSNTAYAHPVLFRRIEDARAKNPDLRLIVIDPRATDTASLADLHLPVLPGTDVALFNAMLHVLVWDGLVDQQFIRAHTTGFDVLKEAVREYTPQAASDICGVPAEDIVLAARWFGSSNASLSLYCQGLNQSTHGTDSNATLINLHLATGHIGKPGAGPFSLTGQPNAMGGREVGGMANLLSAHRNLADAGHRAEVARLWGIDTVPDKPGKTAVELFDAVAKGEVKAIWISCTNPAHSMPDAARVREALKKAELVVVQEAYRHTDTTAFADVLLPASSWGEKEGTVTNSERRISRVRKAVPAPGEARPDWEAATAFARRLEERLRSGRPTLFPYRSPEDVFNEHRETTRGRDLDITGLSYGLLESRGPQQWPFPEGAESGKPRLFEDGEFPTPDGRARFAIAGYRPPAEKTDARYPLRLNTGRLRDHWHGMSRSGQVPQLFDHGGEPAAYLHPEDMLRRGVKNGDFVRISSRRGSLTLAAAESIEVRPGHVFVPMHWNSQFLKGHGPNALTISAYDPVSKQPELKHAAVRLEKADLPWRMVAMATGSSAARREALQPLLEQFDFASCVPFGRERDAVLFRAASREPAAAELLARIDHILGLDDESETIRYLDSRRNISKSVRIHGEALVAVRLCGETAACDWLKDTMAGAVSLGDLRRWVLAPMARPPAGFAPQGRVVCNCLNVSEHAIRQALDGGADLSALQARLKCGTECGSCLPEIKRMVAARPQAA
ncbi:MAG: molybdopterin-dependent oxidoreductase [Betaproteobacteria bacterium]|nr:molybdopterin-dependent oxidoreductase [Betaproteobacteria bacterium]